MIVLFSDNTKPPCEGRVGKGTCVPSQVSLEPSIVAWSLEKLEEAIAQYKLMQTCSSNYAEVAVSARCLTILQFYKENDLG